MEDAKDRANQRLRERINNGQELRIKGSFSTGLQLTGFVYFAQKMRQLKA